MEKNHKDTSKSLKLPYLLNVFRTICYTQASKGTDYSNHHHFHSWKRRLGSSDFLPSGRKPVSLSSSCGRVRKELTSESQNLCSVLNTSLWAGLLPLSGSAQKKGICESWDSVKNEQRFLTLCPYLGSPQALDFWDSAHSATAIYSRFCYKTARFSLEQEPVSLLLFSPGYRVRCFPTSLVLIALPPSSTPSLKRLSAKKAFS